MKNEPSDANPRNATQANQKRRPIGAKTSATGKDAYMIGSIDSALSTEGKAVGRRAAEPEEDHGPYVTQEAYDRLISKYSEIHGQVTQLSEQNRKQVHEIERLRGSNSGFREGSEHLHARIAELEEQLSKAEVQMTGCIDERDRWQESYVAEIQAKQEEAKMQNQLRAENRHLRNEQQSQWARLWQTAIFRNQSEADAHFRLRQRCNELEHAYKGLAHQYQEREREFEEHLKKMNGRMDQLQAHCSSLAKQTGLRRTYKPVEDEFEVLDKFRQLNVAVRYWCWAAWDLKPAHAPVKFNKTPLARRDDIEFTTDEVWVLIACTWEWLLRLVFGDASRSGKPFDLWLDEETAEHMAALEQTIKTLQKPDVLYEWRSFTTQCLFDEEWPNETSRIDEIVQKVFAWLLPMLQRKDSESEEIVNLIREFRTEVIQPAVAFAAMLKRRYVPIFLGTPLTVDSAIRKWVRNRSNEENELQIVTVPEIRKVDIENDPEFKQVVVIAGAEWHAVVEKADEMVLDESAAVKRKDIQKSDSQYSDTQTS